MKYEYRVGTFVPKVMGCGAEDKGWDQERCSQFEAYLNQQASEGWQLHSMEYREVTQRGGCSGSRGAWLVCIFERQV